MEYSSKGNKMKTYIRTEKHKRLMSRIQKKRFINNPNLSRQISERMKGNTNTLGWKDSNETKLKKSISLKLAFKEGRAIPLKGKLHPRWNGFDKNCYKRIFSKKFKNK